MLVKFTKHFHQFRLHSAGRWVEIHEGTWIIRTPMTKECRGWSRDSCIIMEQLQVKYYLVGVILSIKIYIWKPSEKCRTIHQNREIQREKSSWEMFRIKTFMVNFQNDWNYKTELFYIIREDYIISENYKSRTKFYIFVHSKFQLHVYCTL